MVIGLCGLKGSGKDTVGQYFVGEGGFERRAFADPLKESVAALFCFPARILDELKNDSEARIKITTNQGLTTYAEMTFREFLQRYGTESHRHVFGNNFWVDMTLPLPPDAPLTDSRGLIEYNARFYQGIKIVITDVRFRNEANRIIQLGGRIVEIIRPDIDNSDRHESEIIDFPTDFTILNDGSLDDLRYKVLNLMEDVIFV